MPGPTTIARGNIINEKLIAVTLAPGVCAAATTTEQAFTVPGVQVSDFISAQASVAQIAGVSIVNCRVTGANTVAITFMNATAGGITPAAGAYGMIWGRPEYLPLDAGVL